MQRIPKKFNDFSNTALAAQTDIVIRKLGYSNYRSSRYLF